MLVALLCLSSWCLVIVVWLFFTIPRACLQFVIVVFSDHTHLLFMIKYSTFLLHQRYVILFILLGLEPIPVIQIKKELNQNYQQTQGKC